MDIYRSEVVAYKRDSHRARKGYRQRKFYKSKWFNALALLLIPVYLLSKPKPAISILFGLGIISLSAQQIFI